MTTYKMKSEMLAHRACREELDRKEAKPELRTASKDYHRLAFGQNLRFGPNEKEIKAHADEKRTCGIYQQCGEHGRSDWTGLDKCTASPYCLLAQTTFLFL